ncbi:hypothetical protein HDU96_011016 [Phlyctochytrium bullatum]|nr:hypothetical protein HDU96_011016 [Phlyctochytrium bullatum]
MPLLAFGSNAHGQLATLTLTDSPRPVPSHILLPSSTVPVPVPTTGPHAPIAASCGSNHTALVLTDGSLALCGRNHRGQLGFPPTASPDTPGTHVDPRTGEVCTTAFRPLRLPAPVVGVACGWDFTLALDAAGRCWAFGENGRGQLGRRGSGWDPVATVVEGAEGAVVFGKVCAGVGVAMGVTVEGEVWGWGDAGAGPLGPVEGLVVETTKEGLGPHRAIALPQKLSFVPATERVLDVALGRNHSVVVLASGRVLAVGRNRFQQLGPGASGAIATVNVGGRATRALAGWSHSGVVLEDGRVMVWGRGDRFQLGDATEVEEVTGRPVAGGGAPREMRGLRGCVEVAFASESGVAVVRGGTMRGEGRCVAWGWNEHGNCGVGEVEGEVPREVKVPTEVEGSVRVARTMTAAMTETAVVVIATGCGHSLVLAEE